MKQLSDIQSTTAVVTHSGFVTMPWLMWFQEVYSILVRSTYKFNSVPLDYVDDIAAAEGGIAVGEVYRTGSILKVRVS